MRKLQRIRHVACALAALAVFVPVSVRAEEACRAPAQSKLAIELMFGRNVEGRLVVTDRAWTRFVADEVTPRFPEGFSVVDASGQYRNARGGIAFEPSKLMVIVAAEGAQTEDSVAAIVAAYKMKFNQRLVGVLTRVVCASF